ncbi:MAG TPA: ABC transporter substrate-binding protein [Acidimicrobiales bacterium]|nr:ABC transporter substrate-binding protein [Acidimicrobiales bacterium]
MRLGRGALGATVAVCLLTAGCGARVGPYLGAGAGGLQPGGRTQTAGAGDATGPAATEPTGGSQSSPAAAATGPAQPSGPTPAGSSGGPRATGSQAAAAPAVAGPSGFNFDPAAEAAACQGGAGNQASAPGVTSGAVSVGNVSGMTGVLGNTFPQGPQSVQALFSAINAHGGICGRQLKLIVEDDGQDSSHHASDIADLVPRVLAFVGSTSDGDNGGVNDMSQAGVPDLGFAINPERGQSPVYWSSSGSSEYVQNGRPYGWDTLEAGLVQYHLAPKRLAVISYSVPVSAYGAQIFAYGMSHYAGAAICYTDESVSEATASLDQDVLEMKQKGCDGVYSTMDVTGDAKLLEAMQRQDFHPPFVASTPAAYSPDLVSLAGQSAAQGFQVYTWFYPFDSGNQMVRMYQSEMQTYEPGVELNFFGLVAWADAQMFVYALLHAGRNPTRAALTQQLAGLTNWDTGAMMSPVTPRLRQTPGRCIVNLVVKGSTFTRQWPPSGLYCNGQMVPLG